MTFLVFGMWCLLAFLGCAAFAGLGLWATFTGRTGPALSAPADGYGVDDVTLDLLTNPELQNEGISK